jgi:hypothetical protein
MDNLLRHSLKKSYASECLTLLKMRELVPFEVEATHSDFKAKVVEMVFDPFKIKEVNARFASAGYPVLDGLEVIAVNEDGSILLWGGAAGIFYARKGEPFDEGWEENSVYDDVLDLIGRFNIKHKKAEVDEMIAKLQTHYTKR